MKVEGKSETHDVDPHGDHAESQGQESPEVASLRYCKHSQSREHWMCWRPSCQKLNYRGKVILTRYLGKANDQKCTLNDANWLAASRKRQVELLTGHFT